MFFLETDMAQGIFFNGKRSGKILNFTMDVDPGYKFFEKIRAGLQWFMLESKDFISNVSVFINNEIGNLIYVNSQSNTFRLSFKQI